MRKLISSGVLAVLLSMLANTVFAGNVEECEALKDGASPGPGDPPMPG